MVEKFSKNLFHKIHLRSTSTVLIISSHSSFLLSLLDIPIVNAKSNIPELISMEQLKISLEELLSSIDEILPDSIPSDLRILLCFMCGGEMNEIEQFFSQLSSRFTLIVNNYSGNSSFIIKTFLRRSTRKVIRTNFLPLKLQIFPFRLNSFLFHFIRYSH